MMLEFMITKCRAPIVIEHDFEFKCSQKVLFVCMSVLFELLTINYYISVDIFGYFHFSIY